MAQAKQLKEILDSSYTSYKRHLAGLSRAIKSIPAGNTRILKSKIDLLDESLNTLNSAHTAWASKVDLSAEDSSTQAFSGKWLEERWTEADAVLDEANNLLHTEVEKLAPTSLQHNQKLKLLEKQMESLKISIDDRIKKLDMQTNKDEIPPASHPVFSAMVDDVGKQLGGEFRDLSKLILESSGEKCEEVADVFEQFRQKQEKKIPPWGAHFRSMDLQVDPGRFHLPVTIENHTEWAVKRFLEIAY